MIERDYVIMSKDTPVALWKDRNLTVINETLLPLYLKRVNNADMWLETRAIDSHRANSRLLKRALRLKEKDDISTVIHVNGATVTDTYWVKPIDSELTYSDVKFDNDYFSSLALKGDYNSFNLASNSKSKRTPELTNIGSFEKCWKLIDGRWWMYKTANHDEQFSELFTYEFGKALGMNMALYERGNGYVKSLDFTDSASVNFEPAFSFMGDNEDYIDVVAELEKICVQAIPNYVRMIFLDTITANPDRHTGNFGLLRNVDTGELLGLAPCFDHNMALISRGYPSMPKKNDMLISLFNEFIEEYKDFKAYIPKFNEQIIFETIEKVGMNVRTKEIVDLIINRYNLIEKDV